MKKQVFILILLAFFAGTFAFGQAVHVDDPIPVACTGAGPLFPIAGLPYDYAVRFNPTGGSAYWYATTSSTFKNNDLRSATELANPGDYITTATNYMTSKVDGDTTHITWNSAGLALASAAAPTSADPPALFVVVEYIAPAAGCADNLKVYPIRPIDAFTVDIMNLSAKDSSLARGFDASDVPIPDSSCFDIIQSAVWETGGTDGNGQINYNFGTNRLFYEVIAANFTGSFIPSFLIDSLQVADNQTATIDWGYSKGSFTHSVGTATNGVPVVSPDVASTLVTNTSLGVSIFVRVTIENDDFEGLRILPISLAVDAVNAESSIDVVNQDCSKPSAADYVDLAIQRLKPRPTITALAPTPFIPKK